MRSYTRMLRIAALVWRLMTTHDTMPLDRPFQLSSLKYPYLFVSVVGVVGGAGCLLEREGLAQSGE
jgi:hypothetical protein